MQKNNIIIAIIIVCIILVGLVFYATNMGLQVEVPTIVVDHPEEAHPVEILDQAVAPVMDQVL